MAWTANGWRSGGQLGTIKPSGHQAALCPSHQKLTGVAASETVYTRRGARERTRTANLLLGRQKLCQLSYPRVVGSIPQLRVRHDALLGIGARFPDDPTLTQLAASFPVGVRGLEPPTSASQTPRATDCATPRALAQPRV